MKPIFRLLNWSKLSRSKQIFYFLLENENDRKAHTGHYLPKVIYDQWTKLL